MIYYAIDIRYRDANYGADDIYNNAPSHICKHDAAIQGRAEIETVRMHSGNLAVNPWQTNAFCSLKTDHKKSPKIAKTNYAYNSDFDVVVNAFFLLLCHLLFLLVKITYLIDCIQFYIFQLIKYWGIKNRSVTMLLMELLSST